MKDLFDSIYSHYSTSALKSYLKGGFWNTQAPENSVYPYGTFTLITNTEDWTFTEEFEECLIQFNLFSNTVNALEVCNLFELLKTAFDFVDLVINNHISVSVTRENSNLTRIEGVWQHNTTYRILLGKL